MPSFEAVFFFAVFALLAFAGLALLMVLRGRDATGAVTAFEAGEFAEALAAVRATDRPNRESRLAGARAARHLLEFDTSNHLLEPLLQDDAGDGEAWLEAGLTAACAGDVDRARKAFDHVPVSRSDLLESLTLHRAWLELVAGDRERARRLFEEVDGSLETKLRGDLDGGDATFSEWFLHAGWLWRSRGREGIGSWAVDTARRAAPQSRLPDLLEGWRSSDR